MSARTRCPRTIRVFGSGYAQSARHRLSVCLFGVVTQMFAVLRALALPYPVSAAVKCPDDLVLCPPTTYTRQNSLTLSHALLYCSAQADLEISLGPRYFRLRSIKLCIAWVWNRSIMLGTGWSSSVNATLGRPS